MSDVAYYLRRGDLIKIGWSGNLKSRMRALRPDELLAIEPGCRHLETGRHHQFAAHRLPNTGDGDEWFTPAPELLAHIELIARTHLTPTLVDLLPVRRPAARRPRIPHLELKAGRIPTLDALAATLTAADVQRFSEMEASERAELDEDYLVAISQRAKHEQREASRFLAELASRGWSWRRIGTALGVDHTTAYGWVRDAGRLPEVEAARAQRGAANEPPTP